MFQGLSQASDISTCYMQVEDEGSKDQVKYLTSWQVVPRWLSHRMRCVSLLGDALLLTT